MVAKHNSKSRLFVPHCAYRCRAGPLHLDTVIHQDDRSERFLAHVGDVVRLNAFVGNRFTAVGAQDGQIFLVIRWKLLRHGSPWPDEKMPPFHKTKAPSWTSLKIFNFHFFCKGYCRMVTLLPAVFASLNHCLSRSSNSGYLASFPWKLSFVFVTWR